MDFATHYNYHVLAQCFRESHKVQPKSYLLPCLYTTYALLITNSDAKEVFEELFEKSDQAIHYNGDSQLQWSIAGNKYLRKFLPSICFSGQKCDKAVQVQCGVTQTTMQCLENVMLCPYEGHLLIIADIFQTGHGSINFAPVLTFSRNENFRK